MDLLVLFSFWDLDILTSRPPSASCITFTFSGNPTGLSAGWCAATGKEVWDGAGWVLLLQHQLPTAQKQTASENTVRTEL